MATGSRTPYRHIRLHDVLQLFGRSVVEADLARPADIQIPAHTRPYWASLETGPTVREAARIAADAIVDLDVKQTPAAAIAALRRAGVTVCRYIEANGGGAAWGEQQGAYTGMDVRARVRRETLASIASVGSSCTHVDNTDALVPLIAPEHRRSVPEGTQRKPLLEAILEEQINTALAWNRQNPGREVPIRIHLKNGLSSQYGTEDVAGSYADILARRPDLRAHVVGAVIEHAIPSPQFGTSRTEGARRLAAMGIPVYAVEFAHSTYGSPTHTLDAVRRGVAAHPFFAGAILFDNESRYDIRQGTYVAGRSEIRPIAGTYISLPKAEGLPYLSELVRPPSSHHPYLTPSLAETGFVFPSGVTVTPKDAEQTGPVRTSAKPRDKGQDEVELASLY